jgi:predicted permease
MLTDVRYAFRQLRQAPGWTSIVLLSLGLGIGANTALFSAVDGLFLSPLPVSDPSSLVRFRYAGPNDMTTGRSDYGYSGRDAGGLDLRSTFSYALYQQFVESNETLTGLVAAAPIGDANVSAGGDAALASTQVVSGNYFGLLGVRPSAGRLILPDDDEAGAPAVAVLSHAYWQSRFGGDPAVVGRAITVNSLPAVVVGVTEPRFTGTLRTSQSATDVSLPLAHHPQVSQGFLRLDQPTQWWLTVMGRLRPGVAASAVQANFEGVFQQAARRGLDGYLASLGDEERATAANQRRSAMPVLRVDAGSHGTYPVSPADTRTVTVLSVVVVLLLLIVCANVANLLLSRAVARQKECSVRLSLGATRARLMRQLLTESVVLALAAGACGLLVGFWGSRLLPGAMGQASSMGWRALGFATLLSVGTALVFGLAPAFRSAGAGLAGALKDHARGTTGTRGWLTKGLLVAQVALALVLLVGAGLFLQTVRNLRTADIGFDASNLILVQVSPQLAGYDTERVSRLYDDLLERLEAVPGVTGAGLSQPALLAGNHSTTSAYVFGRPAGDEPHHGNLYFMTVSPDLLSTLGLAVLRGRALTGQDAGGEAAPRAVAINETAAREIFGDEDPIGQRFGSSIEQSGRNEVVGVVRDIKYAEVRDRAPATMYVTHRQLPPMRPTLVLRTALDPAALMPTVRQAIREVDPAVPIGQVSTQLANVEARLVQERLFANATALFGLLAVLLAAIGLYGVLAHAVSRRTTEIGLRMAIGADRVAVVRLVTGDAMRLVVAGLVGGVAVALGAGGLIAAQLYEVAPSDPATIAGAVLVLLAAAWVAAWLPARRASLVDPMAALRHD